MENVASSTQNGIFGTILLSTSVKKWGELIFLHMLIFRVPHVLVQAGFRHNTYASISLLYFIYVRDYNIDVLRRDN